MTDPPPFRRRRTITKWADDKAVKDFTRVCRCTVCGGTFVAPPSKAMGGDRVKSDRGRHQLEQELKRGASWRSHDQASSRQVTTHKKPARRNAERAKSREVQALTRPAAGDGHPFGGYVGKCFLALAGIGFAVLIGVAILGLL